MKRARALQPVPSTPTVCLLLRLSKADSDTIEIQEKNGRKFAAELFPDLPIEVFADNGVAGDDWNKRTALGQMMARLRPGDIVISRDAARLGREIVESLNVIREVCQRKQARLFYYQTKKETKAENPTDMVINAVEAFKAESEHKSIIENTKAKLHTFAEQIANGKSRPDRAINGGGYGYRNVEVDGVPVRVVHEAEAKVVRQMYEWARDGMGDRAIARRLNDEGVSPPYADRKRNRKTRGWAPTTIGGILASPRYRGWNKWGQTEIERGRGPKQIVERAEPLVDEAAPSWRIVDDELWEAVQKAKAGRQTDPEAKTRPRAGRASKWPLSAIAKCGACGGSIHVRGWPKMYGRKRVKVRAYGCSRHHYNGQTACTMSLHQSIEEVEGALVDRIEKDYLNEERIAELAALVKATMERRLGKPPADVTALQKEVATLRKRLDSIAEAMLEVDDRRAFAAKHKETSARLKEAERELADAWKAPKERQATIDSHVKGVRDYCAALRTNLRGADRKLKRAAFEALFPGGLYFAPVPIPKGTPLPKKSPRKEIFRIEGSPDVASALVISGRNSFLKRSEMTIGSARKDAKRMVVLALPRAA